MESRLPLISLGCFVLLSIQLSLVEAATTQFVQCGSHQSCLHLKDCAEYQEHLVKKVKDWPRPVIMELRQRVCDKVEESYKFCCQTLATSSTSGPRGRDLLEKECGKDARPRIPNSNGVVDIFEYPWMALLRNSGGQFVGGGTLITKSHVLSAAHSTGSIVSVRVGENDLSKPIDCYRYFDGDEECADPPQDIPVDRIINHPDYSVSQRKHDISVIRLKTPAQLGDSVHTICLPLQPSWSDTLPQKMTLTGWGITEEHGNQTSDVLLYAMVPLVETNECNRIFSTKKFTVDHTQLCAGRADDRQQSCRVDSGGPLQFFSYEIQGFVQHGIAAFRDQISCGNVAVPGVYTKVSNYVEWILENLQ